MNIRKPGLHGQLSVSGLGQTRRYEGSIMGMVAEILKDLHGLNPRTLAEGRKEIVVRFSDFPFTGSKLESDHDRAVEVEALIAWEEIQDDSAGG